MVYKKKIQLIMRLYRIIIVLSFLFVSLNVSSQVNEDDINSLSIFSEYVKAKNYDAAYQPWMELRERNPKFNSAIFVYGERILKHMIKNSSGDQKVDYINDLLKLWDEKRNNFPNKTPLGDVMAKSAQLLYDYMGELNMSKSDVYNKFDNAFITDPKTFNNPKNLYTYFKLTVMLYDEQLKSAEELFTKYDEISEKVEREIKNYTNKVNKFVSEDMSESEVELSKKNASKVRSYNSFLKAYDQIAKGMEIDLGDRANCVNLIPLYEKSYEEKKNDGIWLGRALTRLSKKDCMDSELYVKILEQKNILDPNADVYYYLGIIKDKEGKSAEALEYYNQAIDLENDGYEKAKILFRIATKYKKDGLFSRARSYYVKALRFNPSMGKCYLAIADMYSKSAKNCGSDNFTQRAVYWLASKEALKAGRVDSKLKKAANQSSRNYLAKAPQKSEIFSSGREGEIIRVRCWIGRPVRVPKL